MGQPNPHELREAALRRLEERHAEADRFRALRTVMPRWHLVLATGFKFAATWFLRAAQRLEVDRLEEQASGA
ncbi:hypothetical protein [Oceanithermus sp.]